MEKNFIKKREKIKKLSLLIVLFIIAFLFVLTFNKKITNYAINENQNYSTNLIIEIPQTHKTIRSGENIWFTIKLFNLGNKNRMDVTIKYEILNSEKIVIVSKSETLAIETQASFVRELQLPEDAKQGKYNLYAKVVYANGNEVFAQDNFNVTNNKSINYLIYIIIPLAIIILIAIIIIFFIKSKPLIENLRLKSKIHNIVKNKISE